jgi:hypothetical protein
MNDRLADLLLRTLAGVLVVAGLVVVLIGYIGVRNHSDVTLQVPYFMSGGVGGLALIGLGALTLVQYQMRLQARRFGEITESLDQWKEAALAEVREFLAGAQIELEVYEPPTARRARTGS